MVSGFRHVLATASLWHGILALGLPKGSSESCNMNSTLDSRISLSFKEVIIIFYHLTQFKVPKISDKVRDSHLRDDSGCQVLLGLRQPSRRPRRRTRVRHSYLLLVLWVTPWPRKRSAISVVQWRTWLLVHDRRIRRKWSLPRLFRFQGHHFESLVLEQRGQYALWVLDSYSWSVAVIFRKSLFRSDSLFYFPSTGRPCLCITLLGILEIRRQYVYVT